MDPIIFTNDNFVSILLLNHDFSSMFTPFNLSNADLYNLKSPRAISRI